MLRSAWIFLAAILLPSLVLAWLAVRSARDQQVLVEHQQAIISQDVTDNLAKSMGNQIDKLRAEFVQITQDLLNKSSNPQIAAYDFDHQIREQWLPAEVGFAVDLQGNIYSPSRTDDPAAKAFREENDRFLSNGENVEVYSSLNSQNVFAKITPSLNINDAKAKAGNQSLNQTLAPAESLSGTANDSLAGSISTPKSIAPDSVTTSSIQEPSDKVKSKSVSAASEADVDLSRSTEARESKFNLNTNTDRPTGKDASEKRPIDLPQAAFRSTTLSKTTSALGGFGSTDEQKETENAPSLKKVNQVARQVSPQNSLAATTIALSKTVPEESDFKRLIGRDTSGVLARFLDNKLQLLVWYRPSPTSNLVFGSQLNQSRIIERLRSELQAPEFKESYGGIGSRISIANYCLALLDDTGKPVALSIPGFNADWKHPFVATEIGESLPHWEAALYLTDPAQMSKSARALRLTVGLIVLLLIVAIVAGGSLIATDIRRQVHLAKQKTDFVSNVSHELKTPLTSIRMFADLLAEGRVSEPERQLTYLKIISAESARLTRLINNVLDFARQERGIATEEKRACDLVETTRDVVETCLPHLEASGQNLTCEIEAETLPIVGDRDALAQIVLNLISNAEKYGGGEILVRLRRQQTPGGAFACVDVLDHGPGIPPKQVESIFLPFHRLHDSLSSGIPGSGLGLTLARRIARVHGGDVTYVPRAGGGSCFTLTVPLNS